MKTPQEKYIPTPIQRPQSPIKNQPFGATTPFAAKPPGFAKRKPFKSYEPTVRMEILEICMRLLEINQDQSREIADLQDELRELNYSS